MKPSKDIHLGGPPGPALPLIFSMLAPLLVGLGLFYFTMRPGWQEFSTMTGLMTLTTTLSLGIAFTAYRLGWIHRSPRLQWSLVGASLLAGSLVFLNVWIIARIMFTPGHDLQLATILLVFASGISAAAGFFLSTAVTDRIRTLDEAARRIAAGDLETRVPVTGRDEVAGLADRFNEMVSRLESANAKQKELDELRREMVAYVGHDLRTPLTSMRVLLEALADGIVEKPETVQRYYRVLQQDIRFLAHLIDDLFEISQMEAGGLQLELEPNAIDDLISETIESFSEMARRKGVVLHGEAEAAIGTVVMDARRIGRVLANLTGNALRHTPASGTVHLEARRTVDGIEVEVRDSGEGIRAEDLPHVFDRFYRSERSRNRTMGGSGLGLAIARGFVAAHGGTIRAESLPGQGARFVFTLPLR